MRLIRVLALALCCAAPALAAGDAAALRSAALAASCANCHGTQGKAPERAPIPGLAGLPRDYLVEQMVAFRDGKRAATVMQQIAKGYSDAQLAQLADYFAAQPR